MEAFDLIADLTFHNVEYSLHVSADENHILIEAEKKDDGSRWSSDFSSRYIEEMTSKTGNVKKYPVFCRMLSNAVQRTSDSVFVDLLTMADLEMLRARRMHQQQQLNTSSDHISLSASKEGVLPSSSATSATKSDKRFLILTYLVEFDRVHYPLPLRFEEPTPDAMKRTIRRLRAQNAKLLAVSMEFAAKPQDTDSALAEEREKNRILQAEMVLLQAELQRVKSQMQSALAVSRSERDALEERVAQLLDEQQQRLQRHGKGAESQADADLNEASNTLITQLRAQVSRFKLEAQSLRSRISELEQQDGAVRISELREECESWRLKCADLEGKYAEEQAVNKRMAAKKKKETDQLQQQITSFAVVERNLNSQIKTYKDQLEAAVAKLNKSGVKLNIRHTASLSPSASSSFRDRPTSAPTSRSSTPTPGTSANRASPSSRLYTPPTSRLYSSPSHTVPSASFGSSFSSPSLRPSRPRSASPSLSTSGSASSLPARGTPSTYGTSRPRSATSVAGASAARGRSPSPAPSSTSTTSVSIRRSASPTPFVAGSTSVAARAPPAVKSNSRPPSAPSSRGASPRTVPPPPSAFPKHTQSTSVSTSVAASTPPHSGRAVSNTKSVGSLPEYRRRAPSPRGSAAGVSASNSESRVSASAVHEQPTVKSEISMSDLRKRIADETEMAQSSVQPAASAPSVGMSASASAPVLPAAGDVKDIDSRLQALQAFLKQAKQGVSAMRSSTSVNDNISAEPSQ